MDAADHSYHEVSPVNTEAVLESAQGHLLTERISVLLNKDIVINFGFHSLARGRIMKSSLNLLLVNPQQPTAERPDLNVGFVY